ncbi:Chromosome partitioning protein ParB [Deinococcus saxicola]|uniref:hypothetical protein n=1 Tax=Deinococcus saxicola TaxID=249406 RepID=UPI0039F0FFCF
MSLRDGLKNLRVSREEEAASVEEAAAVTPPVPDKPALEKRETFSTRIRPSVRYALKRQLLEVQEQGHKVRMEDVLEALILRYVEDAEFRAEVVQQIEN